MTKQSDYELEELTPEQHEEKWQWIKKFAIYVNEKLEAGFIIVDHNGEIVSNPIKLKGFGDKEEGFNLDNIVYYSHNSDFDNGYYTPKAYYEEIFSKWRMCQPEQMIPVI